MFAVERDTYPYSPHIEWPWLTTSSNAWVNTLIWVRHNTPKNAVFAVDSRYFTEAGVDRHAFRAISRRSELADYYKDGGAVAVFPKLAVEWMQMSDATYGMNHFTAADFTRLAHVYRVTWTVIHGLRPLAWIAPTSSKATRCARFPTHRGYSDSTEKSTGILESAPY